MYIPRFAELLTHCQFELWSANARMVMLQMMQQEGVEHYHLLCQDVSGMTNVVTQQLALMLYVEILALVAPTPDAILLIIDQSAHVYRAITEIQKSHA